MANKGSFACVIPQTNEYQCSDTLNPEKRYITKIMKNDKADEELANYKNFDELTKNTTNEYYIGQPIKCDLPSPNDKELLNNKDCNYKFNVQDGTLLTLIDYEDGGSSLSTILEKPPHLDILLAFYKKLFNGLLNIFHAVNVLNKKHIYHFDIKPDNIVGDIYSEPFNLRLIDLGDSKYIPSGIDYKSAYDSTGTKGYISPERYGIWLGGPDFIGNKNIVKVILSDVLYGPIKYGLFDTKEIITNMQYKELRKQPLKSGQSWYAKSDVWSLGVTLMDIIRDIKYNVLRDQLGIEDLRNNVIMPMLMLDVEERPDSAEALSLYTNWLERYINKNSVSLTPEITPSPPHSSERSRKPSTLFTPQRIPSSSTKFPLTPTPSPPPGTVFSKKSFDESTEVGGRLSRKHNKFTKRKKQRKFNKNDYKTRRRIKSHRMKSRKY